MKKRTYLIVLCFITTSLLVMEYNPVYGHTENQKLRVTDEQITKEDTNTTNALQGIIQAIEEVQDQIKSEKTKLREAKTQEERLIITKEIGTLKERLESFNGNFEAIATDLDLETFTTKPQKHFDWKEELQVLVGPIMNELKAITARPRLIENLRTQVSYYEKQISLIKTATGNIHNLIVHAEDEKLKSKLIELEDDWNNKGIQNSIQLTVAKYQLADKLSEKKSLLEYSQDMVRMFFKSRGRNFIISVLAFLSVYFLLRYVHQRIYKKSSIHKTVASSFYVRLTEVVYHVFTFVGATGAMLFVLYIFGDWVLLGLAFIFIFGLIWTAKQTLPRFYEHCKLLLNLGTVKENERVVYNGLPWKVASLQLSTHLVNPELKGGIIRLPLRELKDIKSRPYHPDEPWFPCKENDWVILADGTMGRVATQTPEFIQLIVAGGSCKTYPTLGFLNQNPMNISKGFRVEVIVGIDYQYQAISTTEIPDKFREAIKAGLIKEGYGKDIIYLNVEFKETGDSSLDYEILADFSGLIAKDYYRLFRIIQKIALDACNTYKWEIPYTRSTINAAQTQD